MLARNPPLTAYPQIHSILGTCWHVDIENAFTKPLKIYFAIVAVLLCVFLSLKVQLGE